jgi:hypothetical protein
MVSLAAVVALANGAAQVPALDVERLLTGRFAFTPAELAQARSGQAVAKMLPAQGTSDVGVLGAVRIPGKPDRLVNWFKDVASFRKAAELGLSRRISDPPAIGDFADLSLDAKELAALRTCRKGKCDLRMGEKAISRFQTEIDWAAPDAAQRANLLTRQLLLGHVQAYLKGGDTALGASYNEKTPRVSADEFHQVLWQAKTLYDITPKFAAYLEGFPAATLPGSEQFLYWAKSDAGGDASITLHQLVIYRLPGGDVFIADKQLYASRYVDSALAVLSLVPVPDGTAFYTLVGARARSTMLSGMGARLLRNRVESATADTVKMYMNWLRGSLSM